MSVILDEGVIIMLLVWGAVAMAIGHPLVGFGIGVVAMGLFLAAFIMERRRQ